VRVVLLDDAAARHADALPEHCERLMLSAAPDELPLLLSLLSALAANRPVTRTSVGAVDAARVAHCIEWIRAARYGTVAWCSAEMQLPHADLTLQTLARLLRTLNRKGRFAALPLASPDGGLTANAVHTWQTGTPLPASHANGSVAFDGPRYALDAVLARMEADALLWVSSLSAELRPPGFAGPVIVLGRCDMKLTPAPRVFIPVATTGIDAPGVLTRTDDVVSLYLRAARERHLPAAAAVLGMMSERIAAV
jgi:formylmethanofuran dehydrogenase subunit B